jgi:hypothetical protein
VKFSYVKLPFLAAQNLGLDKNRQRDRDGNVIINQSDLSTVGEPDETLAEKVERLGGVLLTNIEALELIQKSLIQ